MPEPALQLLGLKRYVRHGGDELIAAIQSAQNLDDLKRAIRSNLPLISKIRDYSIKDKQAAVIAMLNDIGKAWQQFASFIDNELEFRSFQDFMRSLVDRPEQENAISDMLIRYRSELDAEKQYERGETILPTLQLVSLPDNIDIPEELTLPTQQYSMKPNNGSIWKGKMCICRGPLLITKRVVLVTDHKIMYEVAFVTDTGVWRTAKIPAEHLADNKKFGSYLAYGIQCNANSLKFATQYLSDFAQANGLDIPTVEGSDHLGWVGDRLLTCANDPNLEIFAEANLQPTIRCIKSRGTVDEWIENVFDVAMENKTNGVFLFTLSAALSSLLVGPLNMNNGFFMHIFGASRSGKSTIMKAVSSAVGNPSEAGVWLSWDNTKVFLERYCHFMGSLGVFLDEARLDHKNIGQIVYDISNGTGRGRGTTGGVSEVLKWHLNVISTGEFDIREVATQEGFENRTICLTSKINKSFFAYGGQTVNKLTENMTKYYGSVLQVFAPLVEELGQDEVINRKTEATTILTRYLLDCVDIDQVKIKDGKADSYIGYFAIMLIVLDLFLAKVMNLNGDQVVPYLKLFREDYLDFMRRTLNIEDNRKEKVLDVIVSSIASNISKFYDPNAEYREPNNGWWGRVISKEMDAVEIGIKTDVVKNTLRLGGYSLNEFVRMSEEENCLLKGPKGEPSSVFKLQGFSVRGYRLKLKINT